MRRRWKWKAAALTAVTALFFLTTQAAAQDYPTKSVRFVLPFPPGGGTDTLARIVGQHLSKTMGQSIVMDNRPGAGANIGAEIAAHSAPDGYTLLMGNIAHAVNVTLYRTLSYDFVKDFDPVTLLAFAPNILVTHPSVAVKNVQELIALAKKAPATLNYASSGSGSSSHLSGELFKNMTGTDIVHVPYKGGGPAVGSLLSGETRVGFATMPSVLPQTKSGKLRALAVTGDKRSPTAPEIPTIAESGVAGYAANGWYGVLVPTGTPKPFVAKLHKELVATVNDKEVQTQLARFGYDIETNTPDAFRKMIVAEIKKWGIVVKAANLRAN
ncbi:MAG TPA: tripartite tricarboxylate transporter substrate binding protein [Burkholderiales bacterium]|nr:tripartite tricarboxylate transporter substrate binding protein [Burkholderiales bacterium]